ncbi:MAG TPA: M56 family metallopeptidase [Lacisediminihabitans sp.]|uniref:M56 family metallopeptidase n=1 Tax=Lacisediminihabitans sp. TaxID=2787631 RepID=UPI002EDABB58
MALVTLALLLLFLGPVVLKRIAWLESSPRIGIGAWQALSASAVLSVVLGSAALAVPSSAWSLNLVDLLGACAMAFRHRYSTPAGVVLGSAAAAIALGLFARLLYCAARGLIESSRLRRSHVLGLRLIAHHRRDLGALVIDHPAAAAYCLPGRGSQVVLTSAAIEALDGGQLAAVMAHERAHLRGHHHLVLAAARALDRAFPRVPLFREARTAITRLVEMVADDDAASTNGRLTVATALVRLGEHGMTPAAALGAAEVSAVRRVRRLVSDPSPLGRSRTVLALVSTALLLVVPLLVALVSSPMMGSMQYCPSDSVSHVACQSR